MDINKMKEKAKAKCIKGKEWVKNHIPEIVGYGSSILIGAGIVYGVCKYVDSIPVTVEDVTEVTDFKTPGVRNEITMYDDRLDCWIPVKRQLTEEEFRECVACLEEDPENTLCGWITANGLLPEYLNEYE